MYHLTRSKNTMDDKFIDMDDKYTFFRIEKVLKRKDGKALVRWKGWPSKYDSWVDAKEIVDL